ncbi:MAG TPA: DNA-3-methyladenine glycosylase [Polyangia bacterium]|nr:DNA-3-methyladenine glycosylase [Polyangia bacterium]
MTDAGGRPALAPLPRAFYARPTVEVAHALLGKLLVRRPARPGGATRVARLVEVEAYLGLRDAASHARRGPTPRAAIMFGPPGFLYVYLIYGMHHCMNVVAETDGVAGAVLLRAAAPVAGVPDLKRPLTGPGKLCAGLDITRRDNGLDLTAGGEFYLADDGSPPPRLAASKRIGVEYAGAWAARKLRFYVPGDPYVCKV